MKNSAIDEKVNQKMDGLPVIREIRLVERPADCWLATSPQTPGDCHIRNACCRIDHVITRDLRVQWKQMQQYESQFISMMKG